MRYMFIFLDVTSDNGVCHFKILQYDTSGVYHLYNFKQ